MAVFKINDNSKKKIQSKLLEVKKASFSPVNLNSFESLFSTSEMNNISMIFSFLEIESSDAFATLNSNLDKVESFLSNLPTLTVWLSFEPTISFEEEIAEILSEQIKSNFSYSFMTDQEISTGVILDFKGRRYDYSLGSKFDKGPYE